LDDDSNGYVDDVIGWNFVKGKEDVTDFDGHGTFVAGIVAARANDGLGIAGVAPDAKVMILKVLSVRGGIWYSVDRAIRYAVNNGAKVINMSFGGNRSIFTVLMRRAIDYAYANGVVLVAASGNENSSLPTFPAAYNKTIATSAIDRNMKRAEFSNYGDYVDLTAPGVDILSLTPNGGYANASGTSFATPHVSGVIALLLSKYPSLTPIDVAQTLFTEAKDLGEKGLDPFYGYGLVDALAAVSMEPIPEFRDSGLILVATLLPATFLALRLRRSSRLSKDRHCGGLLRCASPKPAWNRSSSPVKP
jgi:subtilisin family serine protease